jgi:hypothetical protein
LRVVERRNMFDRRENNPKKIAHVDGVSLH